VANLKARKIFHAKRIPKQAAKAIRATTCCIPAISLISLSQAYRPATDQTNAEPSSYNPFLEIIGHTAKNSNDRATTVQSKEGQYYRGRNHFFICGPD
jgi:hypothetical protein